MRMVIRDYYSQVIQQIGQNSRHCTDWSSVRLTAKGKHRGDIWAAQLRFRDDGFLRFQERIVIDEKDLISRLKYSYHYERKTAQGIYFFRYDKDPAAFVPLLHEDCHLHVNQSAPRFPTHETSFQQVFDFVITQFYAA